MPSSDLAALVEAVPALRPPVAALSAGDESPAAMAAAVVVHLEGLHLSKRLNKDTSGTSATLAAAADGDPGQPGRPRRSSET